MKPGQARTSWLVATTAAIALAPVCGVHAQTTPSDSAPPQSSSVGEVIVTAQRRAQRLQDVPFSVTAASAETLAKAGVTSTADLAQVTPGLRYNIAGIYAQPVIRGITTGLTLPAAETNVATYIDGVYQQQEQGAFYQLPDIQEIEVLKGPQGTLFGRNATGGAILINSVNPSLTHATGHVTVGGGNFGDYYGKGFFSVPIIQDKLSASLAFYAEHTDGYERNVAGPSYSPVDDLLIRGKIRFDPWEGADFVLTGTYSHVKDFQDIKNTDLNGNNGLSGVPGAIIASQPWTYSSDLRTYFDATNESVSLRGTIAAGPGTLTTTTAYVYSSVPLLTDGDDTNLPLSNVFIPLSNTKSYSNEEVYATNKLGRFQATFGTFIYYNEAHFILDENNYALGIYSLDKDTSFGTFVDATYEFTDQFSIEAGVRYSWEKRQAYVALVNSGANITPPLLGEHSWDSFTPRVSLLYKVTPQTNLYFTYSEGFKSGVYNTVGFQATPVSPENIQSFEIGAKNNFTPDLSINVDAFYYNYSNLQIPTIIQVGFAFENILQNAASSRIYGVEGDLDWRVTKEFNLTAGATYLNAHYTKFLPETVVIPNPLGPGNENSPTAVNLSGNTMVNSPTFTANLTADYATDTSIGHFDANATAYFSTKVYFQVTDRIVQPDYATLGASLSWQPVGSPVEFRVWGKNLTNAKVIASETINTLADAVIFAPPRTYGVEASYKF